jgi:hypothetical protein
MREQLCTALARFAGQPLTSEVAVQIVRDLFPDRTIDTAQFGSQQCGSLMFQAERLSDIVPEMHALHVAHFDETEGHRKELGLHMDYEAILEEERAGSCLQFTARHEAELVGNFRVYLRTSRHTQTKFAVEDVLFMRREYRNGRTALRFMEYVQKCVASIGYREFRADTKHVNNAGRLLEHMGFKAVATNYVKFLE